MVDIQNRWALVTGASRGVGRRVAKALAAQGCKLVVHSRELAGTQSLVAQLKKTGVDVIAVAARLDSATEIDHMITQVTDLTDDRLDILYNNAAIMTAYRPMFEPTMNEYCESFMVNCIAPVKLCDAFLPAMLDRDWGRIVNVTSGICNEPELMPYSCSKAALERYVRDMMPTLKDTNVLMNLLDPGWLRTDLGGPTAPNDPDTVLPGALTPVLLDKESGSGALYEAQNYVAS